MLLSKGAMSQAIYVWNRQGMVKKRRRGMASLALLFRKTFR